MESHSRSASLPTCAANDVVRFPRILHFVFVPFSNKKDAHVVPNAWLQNIETWRQMHPAFEVRLWTLADCRKLLQDFDPEFLSTFDNYEHGVQRADSIRPFILNHHGGIYVDLDTTPRRSLEPFLQMYNVPTTDVVLAASAQLESYASNWFMMSVKHAAFWRVVIDLMAREATYGSSISPHVDIMNKTGPALVTAALDIARRAALQFNHTPRVVTSGLLCSTDVCGNRNETTSPIEFIQHKQAGSWHSSDSKFGSLFYCKIISPLKSAVNKPTTVLIVASVVVVAVAVILYNRKRS